MESSSTFEEKLEAYFREGWMPDKVKSNLFSFYDGYRKAGGDGAWFKMLLAHVKQLFTAPFFFQPYHEKIRYPFDYYAFGNDFLRPLVDKKASRVHGHSQLEEIVSHLKKGHNVVFLANHQIEADPQAISILLDDQYPGLAEEMIFVAGERVITDPLAIPFSMGRNLLCIYSKRYINHPPEKKTEKQHHNKRALELMRLLLQKGGRCIYVAPSGGRDRRNSQGVIEVAKFDPSSVEIFYLIAKKAKTPTFFYPMALATYHLLPPPETIQVELGETRHSQRGPIHLSVGTVIDMERYPGYDSSQKHDRRGARADYIWSLVNADYQRITQ